MTLDATLPETPLMKNPERAAWGVLLVSFAVSCLMCMLSTIAVYIFLFQSTVPMVASAQPSRGVIGVTTTDLSRQLVDFSRSLSPGNTTNPADPSSQGVVAIRDPHNDNQLVVMLSLQGDSSSVALRRAERPRFEWGNAHYQVEFTGVRGDIDILIADNISREIAVDLVTVQGVRIKLRNGGRYALLATDSAVSLINHNGEAVLIPATQDIGWAVGQGNGIRIENNATEPAPLEPFINLLDNPLFEQVGGTDLIPLNWACRPGVLNAPSSRFMTGHQDGHAMIQFVRGDGAQTNGETSCQQGLQRGEAWRDVSGYDYLAIRTTFFIGHQSLSTCGERASECPLMIRLGYITANGEPRELIYGFYGYLDGSREYPTQCDTCIQPHILVRNQTWYTYESENILAILPEDEKPSAITFVRFYASGHEYDVRVSEVSLLAQTISRPDADTITEADLSDS